MATSKTGSFWLTESLTIGPTAHTASGTIDLGSYVDVGDQQALSIEQVDFIFQGSTPSSNSYYGYFPGLVAGNAGFDCQLSDLNPGGVILRADDQNLIASGNLQLDDANNVLSTGPDFYPDTFGKLDQSRIVVNDQIYVVAKSSEVMVADRALVCTVRIKARIVKLSTKDWMAIAIQSTAADN